MKKLLIILFTIFALAACSNDEAYNEAIQKGLDHIASEEYEEAEDAFKLALEEKENDEKAKTLLDQTIAFQEAVKALEEADLETAQEKAESVTGLENGSSELVERAEKLLSTISELETKLTEVTEEFEAASKQFEDKQYNEANEAIEKILAMDLEHQAFNEIKEDAQALQEEIQSAIEAEKKAEEERIAKQKAEEERIAQQKAEEERIAQQKAEEERIAREKAEEERKALEQAEKENQESTESEQTEQDNQGQSTQGVGAFAGYWLQDTFACHITDTYFACALADSDFITYDELNSVETISDTHIEFRFKSNTGGSAKLLDQNTMQLDNEVFKRVSAEEANAIYGGHYTLP